MGTPGIAYLISTAGHSVGTASDFGLVRVSNVLGKGMEWVAPDGERVKLCTSAQSVRGRPYKTRLYLGYGFYQLPRNDQVEIEDLISAGRFLRVSPPGW